MEDIQWDLPNPYLMTITVQADETDRLGHTNNQVYLKWLEQISWQHIESLGMDWPLHERLSRAMAITRTEIDYLASSYKDDDLLLATWISSSDQRITSSRRFQLVRLSDHKTIIKAQSFYACIDLKTGRPARMPKEFIDVHRQALAVHQTSE
ncbi:MAG: acyl-CoA thioester hydrolase [Bermanella sp.]|jgi:acyl-CoA thioester hydrolase